MDGPDGGGSTHHGFPAHPRQVRTPTPGPATEPQSPRQPPLGSPCLAKASSHPITALNHHRPIVDRGEHLGGVAGDDDVDDSRAVAFFHALLKCWR